MKKKSVAILGSTGSIGKSSLQVLKKLKKYKIEIIFSNKNYQETIKQINLFKPKIIIMKNYPVYLKLKKKYKNYNYIILNDYKKSKDYLKKRIDVSISAIPGIEGLEPTILFTKLSKKVLIANKESIICGWMFIKNAAKKFKTVLVPIDSEHFSINFLLKKFSLKEIKKIYITASGGPFLNLAKTDLKYIKPEDAIKHPKWSMGKKISVDSSTLINKVLEYIEAIKLFSLPKNKLEIVIHPQSLVHAIIELKNNLKILLYHEPDMKIPIANALESNSNFFNDKILFNKKISFNLNFFPIDNKKFPIIKLINKINLLNSSPILFNAANEVFVDQFLKKKIKYVDILRYLELFLNNSNYVKSSKVKANSISRVKKLDLLGRRIALKILYEDN